MGNVFLVELKNLDSLCVTKTEAFKQQTPNRSQAHNWTKPKGPGASEGGHCRLLVRDLAEEVSILNLLWQREADIDVSRRRC